MNGNRNLLLYGVLQCPNFICINCQFLVHVRDLKSMSITSLPELAIVRPVHIGPTDDRDFSMSFRLDLAIEDEKIEIVRLTSARKICVRFRVQGLRRTRRIDLELPKLQSRELPLLCSEMQYSCDNPMVFE